MYSRRTFLTKVFWDIFFNSRRIITQESINIIVTYNNYIYDNMKYKFHNSMINFFILRIFEILWCTKRRYIANVLLHLFYSITNKTKQIDTLILKYSKEIYKSTNSSAVAIHTNLWGREFKPSFLIDLLTVTPEWWFGAGFCFSAKVLHCLSKTL